VRFTVDQSEVAAYADMRIPWWWLLKSAEIQGYRKKMDGIWNSYNVKSTRRIYTFGVLKFSETFKVLDVPQYISICAPFVALETSKRNSISCHVFWIMSRVTVSMADVIVSCRCWIFPIFSAHTVFLMYRHRKKSSGERSGLRGDQGIGPPLPIQASVNLATS